MGIALRDAARMELQLPGLALAKEFYDRAVESGMEDEGTQALYKVLDAMSGSASD